MALTITSSPAIVALTGNPVRFTIHTNNNIATPGTCSALVITFFDTGAAGDSFTLKWADKSLTFVCSPTPDDSGLQIVDLSVIANLNDWVDAATVDLRANYLTDKYYSIGCEGSQLTLTAKNKGSIYDLEFEAEWTNGVNPPTAILTAGVDEVARTFYKLGLQLQLGFGEDWEFVGEDILPVDPDGNATFDLHRLFADRVYSEFQWPESSVDIMVLRAHQCMQYYIRYFEQYGDSIFQGKLTASDTFNILAAGISHLQEAIYNRQSLTTPTSFWTKLQYNQYFLTWQPKEKLIDRWQTEKLYYLVRESIASLNLKIEINYNDDTAKSTITKKTIANPVEFGVYEIICGLNRLQLAGYDTGIIDFYRVWIEDGSANRISEIRTFTIDYSNHEEVRQFLFLNSLGGYDTLRVTGDVEDSIELERSTISKVLGADFTELDHQVAAGSVSEVKTYKANTGWLTREQVAWIRDFFLSKQVYQIVVGKLVPVLVTTTQATQRRDREDLFSIDFKYRRAFSSEFYSMEIVSAQFSDDFNDDFANE